MRFKTRDVLSPPPEASPSIAVSGDGTKLKYTLDVIMPAGSGKSPIAPPVDVSTSNDLLKLVNSVPLTADQHACRHGTDVTKCP